MRFRSSSSIPLQLLQEHIVKDGDKFSDRINPKVMMDILVGGEYGLIFNDNNMWKVIFQHISKLFLTIPRMLLYFLW